MSSRIITALLNQDWAAAKSLINTASVLEIMATTENGLTALHIAIQFNQLALSRALLIRGAKINAFAEDALCQQMTPLHFSALLGHHHCAQLLFAWGADASIKNSQGKTAYDLAILAGHPHLAQSLKPSIIDSRLSSVLELAKVQRTNNPFIREMVSTKLLELENSTPESKKAVKKLNQKSINGKVNAQQGNVIAFPVVPSNKFILK